MKAVGCERAGGPEVLADVVVDDPVPGPRDILVRVSAISVNPVDFKIREKAKGPWPAVLGWDAVGTVGAIGDDVTLFSVGDRVWYSGAIDRPGCDSELHVVDERLAAHAPVEVDDADAAAMPLTTVTAWELLFDRLGVVQDGISNRPQTLLVVGAAGGVGSVLVQLARRLTRLTVIATASRPETASWTRTLGAHHVVDHSSLIEDVHSLGYSSIDLIASLTETDLHFNTYVELIAPQGRIGLIDDPVDLDVSRLKEKSVSLHWELMYTRSLFRTSDMARQHEILTEAARLMEAGVLRSTRRQHFGTIEAHNVQAAHQMQATGRVIGKSVLAGWPTETPPIPGETRAGRQDREGG